MQIVEQARITSATRPAENDYLAGINAEVEKRMSNQRIVVMRQMLIDIQREIEELNRKAAWLRTLTGDEKRVAPSKRLLVLIEREIVAILRHSPTALSCGELETAVRGRLPDSMPRTIAAVRTRLWHQGTIRASGRSSATRFYVLEQTKNASVVS